MLPTLSNTFPGILVATYFAIQANLIGDVADEIVNVSPPVVKEAGDKFRLPWLRLIGVRMNRSIGLE